MTRVSAPGKMVLLGEYAVLFGAPAVVAAVNRRAVVELGPSPSSHWELVAPDLADRSVEFEIGAGGVPSWRDEEDRQLFELVDRVFDGLAGGSLVDLRSLGPLTATLDTRDFFQSTGDGRLKLGLGSSAALAVALISAVAIRSHGAGAFSVDAAGLQHLIDLHRGIQGGRGSGVDVAASFHGGVIRFQLDEASRAETSPVVLPGDLHLRAFWTGRSASTGSFLERLHCRREESPGPVNRALERLAEVSHDGVVALEADSSPGFLAAVDDFWGALGALGRAIDMPIVSEPHQELRRFAENDGVFYKPSGAGGGDLGLGFSTDAGALENLSEAARGAGFGVVDLAVDSRGVGREGP